jgi:hypothetical protein
MYVVPRLLTALLLLLTAISAVAQIRGTPASVTSIGSGGSFRPPGVPASVTSLGPHGFNSPFGFHGFKSDFGFKGGFSFGHHPRFHVRFGFGHHRRFRHSFAPVFVPVYVPTYPVYATPVVAVPVGSDEMEEIYEAGPTVFERPRRRARPRIRYEEEEEAEEDSRYRDDYLDDRERSRRRDRQRDDDPERRSESRERRDSEETRETKPAAKPADEKPAPPTILVFRDGKRTEVRNYAIVGDTLYDFSSSDRRRIALSDLDIEATVKANDSRGIWFRLPSRRS